MEIRDTKNGDNKIILTFSLAQHGLSKYTTDAHVVALIKKTNSLGIKMETTKSNQSFANCYLFFVYGQKTYSGQLNLIHLFNGVDRCKTYD